ncbi:hypothetical protein P3L10_012918 [Capsicum annuum]
MWSQALGFLEQVKSIWEQPLIVTSMYKLVGRLNRLKSTLRRINRTHCSDVENRATQAKARLYACQTVLQLDPKNLTLITQEVSLAQDFIKWNKARVMYLQMKCRAHWLKDGGLNTTFFHSVLKTRRNANRIFRIQDQQGKDIIDTQGIAQSFVHFYTSLLGTSMQNRVSVCSSIVKKGPVISANQREMLSRNFTEKEVKKALWVIAGDKAPGPDGYRSQFFKDCWEIVRTDLIAGVMEFFSTGKCLRLGILQF